MVYTVREQCQHIKEPVQKLALGAHCLSNCLCLESTMGVKRWCNLENKWTQMQQGYQESLVQLL